MADFETIETRSDPAIQRLIDVNRKSRGHVRTMLVEDVEPLLQTIAAGVEVHEVYGLASAPFPEAVASACAEANIPMRLIDNALAGEIFKIEKKPKVFAIAATPAPARLRDIATAAGDIVVLDGVRIVGNIGAIIRTSFALGAGGVVLLDSDLSTIADRRLIRSSRGYVFSLPVILASHQQMGSFIDEGAGGQTSLVTFDAHGETPLSELGEQRERLALVFGSEREGPSAQLWARSAMTCSIPMNPAAESLNVSVSAGVVLYSRAGRNLSGLDG